MNQDTNWREVIHQYLSACAKDAHDRLLQESKGRAKTFIQRCGTLAFKERDIQRMEYFLKSEASPKPPDSYKVIEEHPGLVIAEAEGVEHGEPAMLTRFRLKQDDGSWLLDDIFWKCVCLDANGKCFLCKGTTGSFGKKRDNHVEM